MRDAVTAANGTDGAVITFASTVASAAKPGTLIFVDNLDTDLDDDITTFAPMTIQGPGSAALTIQDAAIIIAAPGLTTVSGLTMLNQGDVVIDNEVGDTLLDDITTINGGDCTCFQVGSAIVKNSTFTGSTQGTLYAHGSLQLSNTVISKSAQVALTLVGGNVTITNTVFDNNHYTSESDDDALFFAGDALEVDGTASVTITDSTFTNNQGYEGAAIVLRGSGSVAVANTTFSGNLSVNTDPGGAGVINNVGTGPLTIRDSTIYANTDTAGGNPITFKTVAPTLINTILAGENGVASAGACKGCILGATNLIGVDPQFGPLGNYSPVAQFPVLQTYVPLPTSPAVCAGSATTDKTDELGQPRPNGACYDIGAVQTDFALVFTVQPTTTAVGAKITPAPAVELTEHGVPVSGELIAVTDSLGAGALTGTTTVPGITNGAAVFTTLSPQKAGPQTLTATFGKLSVTSDVFNTSTTTTSTPTITLTINPTSQTYGAPVASGTFTASATYNNTAVAGAFTYTATPAGGAPVTVTQGTTVLPAASYTVIAHFTPTDTAAYTAASSTAGSPNYVVNKATATVTLSNLTATYNGAAHAATATTTPAGLSVNITYAGSTTAPTAVGSYAVVATITDPNYTGSTTGTLVISKATATVSLSNLTATYNGNPHAVTATTTPAGLAVTITYAGSTTAPSAVGSYAVVATITDPNYTGSATGTLVISNSTTAATVTLSNLTATYNGSPHAVTATTSPAGLAVSITYNGSATAPTAAGSYAIVATITSPNYTGSTTGTLVIAKATATVTLSNLTATYDGNPHAATATTSPAGLAVTLTYAGAATAPTAAGSYAVVATITDPNHTGSATGTLVIAKATATVTLSNLAATYDGNPHAATATTVPAGLAVNLTYNGSATAPTAVGSYAVAATITAPNYTGSATGTLVISAATTTAATVTLSNLTATYDGKSHPATVTTAPAGLTVSVTYNGSSTAPVAAGSYTVVANVTQTGYTGSATGTLIIGKATATITLSNLTSTYDGTPHAATATTVPAGLTVTFTYAGSSTAPTAAGSYAVVATVTDPNYTGTNTGTLVISKATATVTLSNLSVIFDGNSHNATATTVPSGLTVTFTYNGASTAPSAIGSYTVVATITDPNYTGSATGTLVISAPPATDFAFTVATPIQTTTPGGAVTYSFTTTPTGGLLAPVTFSVIGLPSGAVATFDPTTLPASSTAQTDTLTIKLPAQTASLHPLRTHFPRGYAPIVLALLLLPALGRRRLRELFRGRLLSLLLIAAGLSGTIALTGCGSGNGFDELRNQSYTVTVTATSGALQHSVEVTLNVQ